MNRRADTDLILGPSNISDLEPIRHRVTVHFVKQPGSPARTMEQESAERTEPFVLCSLGRLGSLPCILHVGAMVASDDDFGIRWMD